MRWRELDERVVPRFALALQTVFTALRGRPATLERATRRLDERSLAGTPLAPLLVAPLRALPVVVALLIAATGVVLTRGTSSVPSEAVRTLGPAAGASLPVYFDRAQADAVELSREQPGARRLALVSLSTALTPTQTGALLRESGLRVLRVALDTGVGEPDLLAVDRGGELGARTMALLRGQAARRTVDQRSLLQQASALAQADPARAVLEAQASTAARQAATLRFPCACVSALVVDGTAGELAELPALPAVRGVELAPAGARLDALDVRLVPLPAGDRW